MESNRRYCLALDLQDDPDIIEKYKQHHRHVPQNILKSIQEAGIELMDIYITGNRLFMIMEVNEDFDFKKKAAMDAANPDVQNWEALMGTLQKTLPWAKPGEKWVLMEKIFSL